jgi:hypothetical protein
MLHTIPTSLEETIYRLRTYQPYQCISPAEALNYLEQKIPTYQLLAIERHFFPEQSSQQDQNPSSLYQRQTPTGHSDRELACITSLETLIPSSPWLIERAETELLTHFPICEQGIDIADDAVEILRPSIQICLPLSCNGRYLLEWNNQQDWYESMFGFSLKDIQTPDISTFKRLRQRFNQEPPPVRFMPLLSTMLDKTTGNIWLDSTNNEDYYGYESDTVVPWKVNAIQDLIKQWHQAADTLDKIKTLTNWLEVNLTSRFEYVLAIWNTANDSTKFN